MLKSYWQWVDVSGHCMKASTKNELMSEKRENIIQNYIEGYNKFDVEKMLLDLDNEILFQNIENGEINLTLNGINKPPQELFP